ncbi:MAG: YtxH domain-containing protein [Candidatus Aminicenantes bacterium]|nr:YtxH domain-containing protein [Candidatus Aminicenantes bacterium]
MSNKGSSSLEVTLSFLLGTATGFILGVLFAPSSGEETRKKIKEEAEKAGLKAKDGYEKITHETEKGFKVAKEKTYEGIDALKDFVEKKKEELSKERPAYSENKEEETT